MGELKRRLGKNNFRLPHFLITEEKNYEHPRDEACRAGLTIPVWENGTVVRKHPDELEEAE